VNTVRIQQILLGVNMEIYDDLSQCTRCEDMVGTETLVKLGPDGFCEICWDDM